MDVSNWLITGFGENSTLEKYELNSPDGIPYVLKFPRTFDNKRTNWEDLNEMIASQIASMLGLNAVGVEIAFYHGRRACLMKNFAYQYEVDDRETIASLITAEFGEEYKKISDSNLLDLERFNDFMTIFEKFSYYNSVKDYFVHMNFFDILIGNQDRHGHNWQLLFRDQNVFPSPLYDNGASLGWQLPDERLQEILENPAKMHKLFSKALIKAGLDNRETPKIKSSSVIEQLIAKYPTETDVFHGKLAAFEMGLFEKYCQTLPYITEVRKNFLVEFVGYRRQQLLSKFEGGKKYDPH